MAKRGQSGLSLVVGVDKPSGMTSHDVVSRCRRIFGEKRVGHTGTLDPLASGVLPVCVGPATRLDAYMTGHDKRYVVRVVFGAATDTDDCEGEVIREAPVPDEVFDPFFAEVFVSSLVGRQKQLPPVYSAIKVDGVKACDAARRGCIISLEPRDIEVHEAQLIAVNGADGSEAPSWDVAFHVSAGTYIRALARDMGQGLGTCAHVGSLRRTSAGPVTLSECVSLEALEELGERAALDPVRLLGYRFVFSDDAIDRLVANGNPLPERLVTLCERRSASAALEMCACTTGVRESCELPRDGEPVCVIAENKLVALYAFDAASGRYKTRCVFQTGVSRGSCI